MSSSLWFFAVAIVLASFRLGHMLAKERGPFDICYQWRNALARNFSEPIITREIVIGADGQPHETEHKRDHWVLEGSTCPICISWNVTWILSIISGIVLIIAWAPLTGIWAFGLGAVALSGGTLIIQKFLR